MHHIYHEGQFVLMEDFNFLNKNRKLAPRFLGPFRILRVKGPHNVELLLTNGRKIVVNVAQVKPYFRSYSSKDDINGFLHLATYKVTDNVSLVPPSFHLPPLSLTHSRHPGRLRKPSGLVPYGITPSIVKNVPTKVLSPSPTISFSKLEGFSTCRHAAASRQNCDSVYTHASDVWKMYAKCSRISRGHHLMSPSVPRLFVNNVVNFMIFLPLPFRSPFSQFE
jgi:hypothetical protein